jgi:hypothetical protein
VLALVVDDQGVRVEVIVALVETGFGDVKQGNTALGFPLLGILGPARVQGLGVGIPIVRRNEVVDRVDLDARDALFLVDGDPPAFRQGQLNGDREGDDLDPGGRPDVPIPPRRVEVAGGLECLQRRIVAHEKIPRCRRCLGVVDIEGDTLVTGTGAVDQTKGGNSRQFREDLLLRGRRHLRR